MCFVYFSRFATSHTEDDFCPVTLLEQSTVCNVSHDCAVEFRDKVYFLANQRCMLRFLAAPERYQLKVRHVEKCPPPVVTRRSQFEINRMLHRHGKGRREAQLSQLHHHALGIHTCLLLDGSVCATFDTNDTDENVSRAVSPQTNETVSVTILPPSCFLPF